MQPFLKDILICPDCGRSDQEYSERTITCSRCQSVYRIEDGIPYFVSENRYWGNLPQDQMRQIVGYAGAHGFHAALSEKIPKYLHSAILSTGRADARFFLPIDRESVILDLGCMWGGLTFALAEHCRNIVGLDQTLETLQLSYYRAKETGVKNVSFLGGDARRIPLRDNVFDVVILNGVLEWLGLEDEYVVERQWGKKSTSSQKNGLTQNPRFLQLKGLEESLRVLKPGGTLCLAIENRIRAGYFFGTPDDHNGLPYASLLPRRLADLYSRWVIGQPYRTYTYTLWGLRKLLREAGFVEQTFLTAFPSYERPMTILPLDLKLLEFYLMKNHIKSNGIRGQMMYRFLCSTGLARATVPNFIVTTEKRRDSTTRRRNPPFQQTVFQNWSTLFPHIERPRALYLMKFKSRMEEGAPVSFLVFSEADRQQPLGYLKVNRDQRGLPRLIHEAELYDVIFTKCQKARKGLAKQIFSGHLGEDFVISRSIVDGQSVGPRLFQHLDQPQKAELFKELATRAIDWLVLFNSETYGSVLTFETFWDRFVMERLSALSLKNVLRILPDALESYYDTLKELAGNVELRTGALHGDYNFCNILVSRENIGIVDWEYAEEESFPSFDVLNLVIQSAVEYAAFNRDYPIETLFNPEPKNKLSLIANDLLARYSASHGFNLNFIKACAPLFILDLLYRDYGLHEFPLRSAEVFKKLLDVVLQNRKLGNRSIPCVVS